MSATLETLKPQFRIMKIIAVSLIAFIFAMFSYLSYRQNFKVAQPDRGKVPGLGPISARPSGPDLSFIKARLAHTKGQILHINFWASWCEPCRNELKEFRELASELGTNYHMLFVNADTTPTAITEAKKMLDKWAPLAPSLFDDTQNLSVKPARELIQKMNVESLPYHIVLDRQGRIAAAFVAPLNLYKNEFKKLIADLLAEKQ